MFIFHFISIFYLFFTYTVLATWKLRAQSLMMSKIVIHRIFNTNL